MLYPHFLRKIVPRAILGAILIAGVLTATPVFAYNLYRNPPSESVFVGGCLYNTKPFLLFDLENKDNTWFFRTACDPPEIPLELDKSFFLDNHNYSIIQVENYGTCGYSESYNQCIEILKTLNPADWEEKFFSYPYGIIFFQSSFLASILAYAGRLFNDLNPMILMWIGIAVGFWVIQYLIDLIVTRSRKNK
jgi:hypothetical protein